MIRAYDNYDKSNWKQGIMHFEVALNSILNVTTELTPIFLKFGLHPRILPIKCVASSSRLANSLDNNILKSTEKIVLATMTVNRAMARQADRKGSLFIYWSLKKYFGNKKLFIE